MLKDPSMKIRPTFTAAILAVAFAATGCQSDPGGTILPSAGAAAAGEIKAQLKCGNVTIEEASLFNIGTACVGLDMFAEWTAQKSGVTLINGSTEAKLDKPEDGFADLYFVAIKRTKPADNLIKFKTLSFK